MDILIALLASISLALSGWSLDSVVELREQQSADEVWKKAHAEASTDVVDADDELELWKTIGEIKASMAALASDAPPDWFVDRVDRIDARLEVIEQYMIRNNDGGP